MIFLMFSKGIVLLAVDCFCNSVTFGMLGTFQRVYKCKGSDRRGICGHWSLREVGCGFLVAIVKEGKKGKKLDSAIFLLPLHSNLVFLLSSDRRIHRG